MEELKLIAITEHFAYERLHSNLLQYLKLVTIGNVVDNYLEAAAKDGKTTLEVLDYLIDLEKQMKENVACESKMRLAMFPVYKKLEDFDLEFQPFIDMAVIFEIASMRFVHMQKMWFFGTSWCWKVTSCNCYENLGCKCWI